MLGDAIIQGIIQLRKILKEKITNPFIRIPTILGMAIVAITPLLLFDYWVGSIIGLVIVTIMFLFIIFRKGTNS